MAELIHPIPPVYRADAHTLILGSFPSVVSRAGMFYYHHPQNRFWRVLAAVFEAELPQTVEEKKALLLQNRLALWDAVGRCEICGSRDGSIRNVQPNDVCALLAETEIARIFCNGTAAYDCYTRNLLPQTGIPAVRLPSTSPANAAWSLPRLIAAWRVLRSEEMQGG